MIGCPIGIFRDTVFSALRKGQTVNALNPAAADSDLHTVLIGEPVTMGSLAAAIALETGRHPRILCPLEQCEELLTDNMTLTAGEEEVESQIREAKTVIADPLYRPIVPCDAKFVPLPHEAFSGRVFQKTMPNMITLDPVSLLGGNQT